MEVRKVNLKNYSSLRVGGEGDLISFSSLKELLEIVMYVRSLGLRIHILGGGTNTFFGEHLNASLVLRNEMKGISFEEKGDEVFVTSGAGELWDDLVLFASEKKLWGIENLSAIPGTVGASPVQNIGAYGTELADIFVSLTAFDVSNMTTVEISKEACAFGYRDSLFKHEGGKYIITGVTLKLSKIPAPNLTYKPLDSLSGKKGLEVNDVRNLVIKTRKEKLPNLEEYPNAGSFFKNPVVNAEQAEILSRSFPDIPQITCLEGFKIPAAWLIEHIACMKGERVKDVGTWPNQPLVLVNYGKATGLDILDFSNIIIAKIKEKTGITLEREVNYID